ncbi:hypothetical protein TBLA_0C00140 [Henningerozyma blattae CBS 6284]|uniref:Uncharacterized protein n=1 Tax=Henningerozyma blattae (strain ATCC 34711 / CBS 6284 / DSM 70876 / NBRC 10599 / NRRL Y-10934 / UCD 77-7) TaxID=1071380 RepID=I2H0D4_HENB6|nr:hypothetical protein TBLA_0C00140 [Tetrapisispora blattae CBS 6284]CCH59836.1 hypothetical protein TBLA_0C00140 [Tetrapisispora blattae CBS 6284]
MSINNNSIPVVNTNQRLPPLLLPIRVNPDGLGTIPTGSSPSSSSDLNNGSSEKDTIDNATDTSNCKTQLHYSTNKSANSFTSNKDPFLKRSLEESQLTDDSNRLLKKNNDSTVIESKKFEKESSINSSVTSTSFFRTSCSNNTSKTRCEGLSSLEELATLATLENLANLASKRPKLCSSDLNDTLNAVNALLTPPSLRNLNSKSYSNKHTYINLNKKISPSYVESACSTADQLQNIMSTPNSVSSLISVTNIKKETSTNVESIDKISRKSSPLSPSVTPNYIGNDGTSSSSSARSSLAPSSTPISGSTISILSTINSATANNNINNATSVGTTTQTHIQPQTQTNYGTKRQRTGPSCDKCRLKKIKCNAVIDILIQDEKMIPMISKYLHHILNKFEFLKLKESFPALNDLDIDDDVWLPTNQILIIKHIDKLILFKPCLSCCKKKSNSNSRTNTNNSTYLNSTHHNCVSGVDSHSTTSSENSQKLVSENEQSRIKNESSSIEQFRFLKNNGPENKYEPPGKKEKDKPKDKNKIINTNIPSDNDESMGNDDMLGGNSRSHTIHDRICHPTNSDDSDNNLSSTIKLQTLESISLSPSVCTFSKGFTRADINIFSKIKSRIKKTDIFDITYEDYKKVGF